MQTHKTSFTSVDLTNLATFVHQLMWRFGKVVLLLTLLVTASMAQDDGSSTDGTTPSALTPGAPAGSYALSGFENINPFNGGMNFHLPLHAVRGRAGAGFTMMLPLEQKWRVERFFGVQFPAYNWWEGITPGYGPGVVQMRQVAYTCQGTYGEIQQSNTRITFTAADGTEYQLWDTQHNGENQWFACYDTSNMPSRGTVFKTIDSESATFVSDTTIHDWPGTTINYPSGYLMLRDGTRYRIDDGTVTWMRDKNGNKLTFAYDANSRVTTITDSLNRQITVTYDVDDGSPYGVCDRITFKGYNGATRYLRISKTDMSNVLRSGYSIHTYSQLFPEFSAQMPSELNPTVIKAVWLPDGRSYQFQYNDYAELARVILPTGGAYEYDYNGGISGGNSSGTFVSGMYGYYEARLDVYRRLIERRTYPDGGTGSSYTLKNVYSRPENSSGGNLGYVDMDDKDSSGTLLARSRHYFYGSPVGSFIAALEYPAWDEGREYKTEEMASDGSTVLRRTEHTWTPRTYFTWSYSYYYYYDPSITQTVSTLVDTSQISKETYNYDQFNNRTDVYEYDYGSGSAGSLIRRTHTDYLTTNPVNYTDYTGTSIHIRSLPTQISVYDASANEKARTTFEYDNYTSDANHAALTSRSGISGLDSAYSTSYTTRGNATQVERVKFGSPNTSLYSYSQYDVAGNVVKTIDPRGNATLIGYDDCFGGPDGNATTNSSPSELSSVSQSSFALVTSVTNAANQTANSQYDYYLGRPVEGQDANGVVASGFYDDSLDRPTKVILDANNLSSKSQRLFTYDDTNKKIATTSDFASFNDQQLKSEIVYDGLGRTTDSRTYESATAFITVRQTFDALGRKSQVSNPFRSGDTIVWTTTGYDSLSRATSVTTPDGAVVTTDYSGNAVMVTDQAGKLRRSITDALGRLVRLDEPDNSSSTGSLGNVSSPNQATSYSYDVLDDLTQVSQGSQTRGFVYDSLKRLTSATNPESGTVSYSYDANGNLTSKTDARTITTTIAYDVLNRPTQKSYNDNSPQTPTVNYFYDSQTLPSGAPSFTRGYSIGRLVAVTYGGGSAGTYRGYDALGRVPRQYQQTDSTNYLVEAAYNIGGPMSSETYPSVPGASDRRTVSFSYDGAARLSSLSSSATSYAAAASVSSIGYAAHNALSTETYGNSLVHEMTYNTRLQPNEIKLGTSGSPTSIVDITYSYGTTSNNGNVQSISYSGGGLSYTQSFTYDSLNRLATAQENSGSSWSQTNGYDRYGNRWIDLGGGSQSLYFSTSTNQITTSGYSYDSTGNLTNDTVHTYTFDAENKILKVDNMTAYVYDGEGQRVKKLVGENTRFIYGIGGELVAEFNGSNGNLEKEYVYGGGMEATIEPSSGTKYTTSDALGSPRIVTNASSSVVSRHDYMPFGEELGSGVGGRTGGSGYDATDGVRQKFTAKERDNETGLDYFINRYYSSGQGRFTSADPVPMTSQRPSDPQRLNLYAYVRNNPLIYADPNGLDLYFDLQFDANGKLKNWSDAKKYKKYLEKGTGLKLDIDKQTGKVTIKSAPTNLNGAGAQIQTIINDTVNTPVRVGASNNSPNVLVGQFNGGGHQTLDFADIDKVSKKGGATKESIVVHETTEAYEGVKGSNYPAAHATAIGFENDVRAAQGRAPRVGESGSLSPSGQEVIIKVDFTTHIETITVDANNQGTIKRVKVEKKP